MKRCPSCLGWIRQTPKGFCCSGCGFTIRQNHVFRQTSTTEPEILILTDDMALTLPEEISYAFDSIRQTKAAQ